MHTSYTLDDAAERCLAIGLLRLGLDGRLRKTRAAAASGPGFHWSESNSPSQSSSTQAGPLAPISQAESAGLSFHDEIPSSVTEPEP
jgi:hypothetical protein